MLLTGDTTWALGFSYNCIQVGCTPLHRAASTGNGELCELLIEEGAEVDAVDRTGQTPLMHAVICQNNQVKAQINIQW